KQPKQAVSKDSRMQAPALWTATRRQINGFGAPLASGAASPKLQKKPPAQTPAAFALIHQGSLRD
ncbi:hypothetical protein PWG14_02560, partial (plasmid) [Chromobacterium amazonense]|uniref:hypothetical protein n=1 Tax=Chromobacterium amazonense TaxID=1382803 RepID=UPI00237E4827